MKGFRRNRFCKRVTAIFLAAAMGFGGIALPNGGNAEAVYAAETGIRTMEYFSTNDGPVLKGSGVDDASYGFVMPKFNGGESSWEDVSADLSVRVKVNDTYTDIDSVSSFVYNQNWGHWHDGGVSGYWFKVSETTYLQLYSKSTGASLDYTLDFTKLNKTTITSMTATDGPVLTAGPTGSIGFTYPTFNGDTNLKYEAVASDLKVFVKPVNSSEWVDIDNNAASGWIYDNNFGQFKDGPGGYWFTLTESINVKLESKTSGVSLIYTLNYEKASRNSYKVSAYDASTTYNADESGAIGFPLPKIDGNPAYQADLDNFVYEVKINGNWVELGDYSKSTFSYSGNGYNNVSDKNQWGYWVDYIYGLWFQPIQQDYELRIGYPENGVKGGAINDNYVYYTLVGNPNAPRPIIPDAPITPGDSSNPEIEGWELVFNDEFTGNALNTDVWNYVTGYYLNDDPNTWGWGNNELEHYTDSEKNVYVSDGNLNITAYEEPKSFPQDPNRQAPYSSGKITTQDKISFKYGRIDFRAKLPSGNGLWPALWLLPNDDTYGTWAASGEIDVMEARGRVPGASSGAIHYGGVWPANRCLDGAYAFENGERIDTDYHVYSLVWEEDMLKWYVDGNLFFFANSDQWYSTSSNAKSAPFDQEFYIIMNLAVGGWFDNGITPDAGDVPATMQVDYVRVYKAEGDTKATISGSGVGSNPQPSNPQPSTVAVTGISMDKKEVTLTQAGQTTTLTKTIAPSNATNKNVTWTSSNPAVATVSAGQVTAVANGTAVITATTQDGNFSDTCVVTVNIPVENKPVIDHVGDDTVGFNRTDGTLEFYVNGAEFADLHYKVNNGGQINVGMVNAGNRNFTYTVSDLNIGDTIEYFFTYNPGTGALDSAWESYTLTAESKNPEPDTENPGNNGDNENPGGVSEVSRVTMYTDADYKGKAVSFEIGEYNMDDMVKAGIANDSISSIKVPLGYKLTVFKDINFAGASKVYSAGSSYVGNDWNDQITSFIIEEASYYIYNRHSNLVLDIANAINDNGANLIQNSLSKGGWQQWKVAQVEDGYYSITSVMNNKAIDVADYSTSNGGNVHVWDYVNGENQKWAISSADGAYKTIVNKLSGLSLDGDDWSTTPGGNIIQWELGDKQANQLWKFELVNQDPAVWSGNAGTDPVDPVDPVNPGGDYADKPELRTDIEKRDDQMFFQFNNKTNGAYSDDEIYWSILGFDPKNGKLCYVDKDGNLIPATTALNTISKGDRMCADVFYTLAEKNYVYMPDIVSGRMYISYGSPVYVTINSDANGNTGFAGPDLNNTSDPNQDVLFEFVEFTITNGEYWGNTTRVDFFSFPVVSRLVGEGGFVSTPGDADVYDKTVGDIGTREEIFAAFKNEAPTEFQTLVQDSTRIMAPCKATFNEGGIYENYFDAYIDEIWDTYRTKDLVFKCEAGTFRGRTSGNSIIFSKDGGESNIVVNKPTTQDVLEGKGTLATGTDIEKVVEAQLCAAINRGVALTPEKWSDSSAFYQTAPANFYSKFFHDHSVDGLAYGFCYDDVFDYSTLLHYTEPTALVIDLKW